MAKPKNAKGPEAPVELEETARLRAAIIEKEQVFQKVYALGKSLEGERDALQARVAELEKRLAYAENGENQAQARADELERRLSIAIDDAASSKICVDLKNAAVASYRKLLQKLLAEYAGKAWRHSSEQEIRDALEG